MNDNEAKRQDAIAEKLGDIIRIEGDCMLILGCVAEFATFLISKVHEGDIPAQVKLARDVNRSILAELVKGEPDESLH